MSINCIIHRGSKEIGGNCVEFYTNNTRIVIDLGIPLNLASTNKTEDLISALPRVKGLFDTNYSAPDAVLVSHAHKDHYGFLNLIQNDTPIYIGKATYDLISMNANYQLHPSRIKYLQHNQTIQIGDFKITPYTVDHSAFDAYAFLIEYENIKIFYSGDFRAHGRKRKCFYNLFNILPSPINYLFLEGTNISKICKKANNENGVEHRLVNFLKQNNNITLIYTSTQNIDRLISIYKACLLSNKTLVIDPVVADTLLTVAKYAKVCTPGYNNIKVMFPQQSTRLYLNNKKEKFIYDLRKYKITKDEINKNPDNYVVLVRPSMMQDLKKLNIQNGTFIYSMWKGYLEEYKTLNLINFFKTMSNSNKIFHIHTSGHADINTLFNFVNKIKPNYIVPIHTSSPELYSLLFKNEKILKVSDCESFILK